MSEAEQTQGTTKGTEGRVLAGRYRLRSVLGRGGMGTVWRAVDETLGRTVAVKELRFPSSVDEDEKRRLITRTLREAKAIARIRSNGAVTVYDVVDEDDRPWIVMELIEGSSLAEVIREKGRLTPRRTAEVGLAVLDVLRAAHRQGILHRDVKPSNVLISGDDGRVVLTDFGIAQVEGDPSVTSTGMLVGAPSYISPERARGQKPGPPADLWSLGGLLYACVEGVPPYDKGSALTTLTAVMTEPVEPPKHAGPLTEVIYGLLAKDPDQRLDDAGARSLLNGVLDAPETPEHPESGEEPAADATRMMTLPPKPAGPAAAAAGTAATAGAGPASGAQGGPGAAPASGAPAAPRPGAAARAAAEERLRSALRAVRNAAAARKASAGASSAGASSTDASPASSAPSAPSAGSAAATGSAAGGPAAAGARRGVTASLTDVVPRRTLAVIAAVVVLAVLALVLVFSLGDDDTSGGGSAAKDNGTSAGKESGQDGGSAADGSTEPKSDDGAAKPDEGGADGEDGAGDASGDGAGDKSGADDGGSGDTGADASGEVPEGYAEKTDGRFHFSMAIPEGWKRTGIAGQNSGGIYSESGGFPRVQIDFNSSPTDDAAAAWRSLEDAVRGSMSGYKSLGIKSVDYRDYPTAADWSFERNQGGERVRVLNRGFKVDATHGYSIMITCVKDTWDEEECRTLRETAFATFRPRT